MDDILLTIYILHFEAPEKLACTLDSLLPFESTRTVVMVGDNSRSDCARPVIEARSAAFKGRLRHVKHACNIGPLGNIPRAYEVAEGQYVWIVGMGDRFMPGGLAAVESIIAASEPTEAFHTFFVNGLAPEGSLPRESVVYSSFEQALAQLRLGLLGSINSTVYRLESVRPHLWRAYATAGCLLPHTALICHGIGDETRLRYHPRQVFERMPRSERSWDAREFVTRLPDIYHSFDDEGKWRAVRGKLIKQYGPWLVAALPKEGHRVTMGLLERLFGGYGVASLPLIFRLLMVRCKQRKHTKNSEPAQS